jgi:bifunctional non-homologous end joining protein LigD
MKVTVARERRNKTVGRAPPRGGRTIRGARGPSARAVATAAVESHPVTRFTPLPLRRMRDAFDDPEWLFELKYDGYRALAHVHRDRADPVSRNGNRFGQFAALAAELRTCLRVRSAVLDGEVVCLDGDGRPQFNALLFRRSTPAFVAFDVLTLNGRDVRSLPLLGRKEEALHLDD